MEEILCNAHGCRFDASSKRFIAGIVVHLCKNHAHILDVKAVGYVWNQAVLEWLLETPPNAYKTKKFSFRNHKLLENRTLRTQ